MSENAGEAREESASAPETRASEPLITHSPDGRAHIRVLGVPRAPVPRRLPVAPRFGGCASGAGIGVGADAAHGPGFRRLPAWLKVKLPGAGEYAETRALLRGKKLE